MQNYLDKIQHKESRLIQKSILDNDDHCKPITVGECIGFAIFCVYVVSIILWRI